MLLSNSFIPILKNNPSEAKIKSHQLMLRVGMIKQASAGIYSWLPLGVIIIVTSRYPFALKFFLSFIDCESGSTLILPSK